MQSDRENGWVMSGGGGGVLRMTVHVTSKETGLTETRELVGRVTFDPAPEVKDSDDE